MYIINSSKFYYVFVLHLIIIFLLIRSVVSNRFPLFHVLFIYKNKVKTFDFNFLCSIVRRILLVHISNVPLLIDCNICKLKRANLNNRFVSIDLNIERHNNDINLLWISNNVNGMYFISSFIFAGVSAARSD